MDSRIETVYNNIKKGGYKYDEERHCKLILAVMMNKDKGRISAFCIEAMISESTFYRWVDEHQLFRDCYLIGKMFARELWEKEGQEIRDKMVPMGQIDNSFEYWRLIGWSRFGVAKNARIKLNLKPESTPDQHYTQLLKQASEGDFTASEIKQLMEAINVGLNAHQSIQLQKDIDELKSDLAVMQKNSNG